MATLRVAELSRRAWRRDDRQVSGRAGSPPGCRIARAENTWRLLVCLLKDKTWLASDTKGINPFARRRRWHGIFVRRAQMERPNRRQTRDKERGHNEMRLATLQYVNNKNCASTGNDQHLR